MKKYETPEMKLVQMTVEDVITTSVENETDFVPFSEDSGVDVTAK